MSLYHELKRRNVIRVAMAYVVASWLIIQVVETILPAYGLGDAAIRLVVTLLAVAFIPTLVFSWAFEITPEGFKREVDVVREHSITRFTGKKIDHIIMVLLALGMGYFAFDKFALDPARDEAKAEIARQEGRSAALTESYGDRSIAVLPFADLSPEGDQEYFSDGISEELLNLLSKIPELRVISRSSAFSFKGKNFDIPTIAAQLNVAYILEGSVRKDGKKLRITAQLIEARSDTHLWSDTYDRELENVFAIQDEISAAIVAALKGRLDLDVETGLRTTTTASIEAHDAFLRGRHLLAQRSSAGMRGAVREFERAIELDPDYALAHAELAMALSLAGGYRVIPRAEARTRAIRHAERAMALDPQLAEAHAAAGRIFWAGDAAYEDALSAFNRAIQINPNYSIVYSWKALILGSLGHYKEMYLNQEQALRLDPLSVVAMGNYLHSLVEQNRLDDAARELEKIRSISPITYAERRGRLLAAGGEWAYLAIGYLECLLIDPDSRHARGFLSGGLAMFGLKQEALATSPEVDPWMLNLMGRPQDAIKTAEANLARAPANSVYARGIFAGILAEVGEFARARPLLEEMWERNNKHVNFGLFGQSDAAALIAILRHAGEEAGVDELLAARRDDVRRLREAGFTTTWYYSTDFEEGLTAWLAGERTEGLSLIARASEGGYFIMPNKAYLQSLYDDPGFAPIMSGQEARQARERERFLSIVCIDNPYEAVWQPAEETCEWFAAEGGN